MAVLLNIRLANHIWVDPMADGKTASIQSMNTWEESM